MNKLQSDQAKQEIIKLHNSILESMRRAVPDAIRIGQILIEQKERLDFGQFTTWLGTLPFGNDTSHKYMRLAQYSCKLTKCVNLQEAYKQIESFEAAEKRKEQERKENLIRQYIKTGEKPDGWDRSLDYEYKKRIDAEAFQQRKKEAFEKQQAEYKKRWGKKQDEKSDINFDSLKQAADIFIEHSQKRTDFKNKIRLSDIGKDDPFVDAILDYLAELENDTRRIEACNNIIKVCRNICIGLQSKSAN